MDTTGSCTPIDQILDFFPFPSKFWYKIQRNKTSTYRTSKNLIKGYTCPQKWPYQQINSPKKPKLSICIMSKVKIAKKGNQRYALAPNVCTVSTVVKLWPAWRTISQTSAVSLCNHCEKTLICKKMMFWTFLGGSVL